MSVSTFYKRILRIIYFHKLCAPPPPPLWNNLNLRTQCMIFRSNVKLCSVRWCVYRYFLGKNVLLFCFIVLQAFLDTGLPRGNRHERCHPKPIPQPGKVDHTTGVYVLYSFRTIVLVLLRPTRTDQMWHGTYGVSSLSEKTRKSNHLQMSLQRQHFLLSYLKTLSVGPVGVWTRDLPPGG